MHNGSDINLYVIADDTENNVGAPARVVEGKAVPDKGEIIIDGVVGRSENNRIGNSIPVADRTLKVAGYSEGGYILNSPSRSPPRKRPIASSSAYRIEADPAVDAGNYVPAFITDIRWLDAA